MSVVNVAMLWKSLRATAAAVGSCDRINGFCPINAEAAIRQQILTDPHTPGAFRPYVVRNNDAWYKAFKVKPGQKFYLPPEARIKVW